MKSIVKTLNTAEMLWEPVKFPHCDSLVLHYLQINHERLINIEELAALCRCDPAAFTYVSDYVTINNCDYVKDQHVRNTLEYFGLPKDELADLFRDFRDQSYWDYYAPTIPPEVLRAVDAIIEAPYLPNELSNGVEWLIHDPITGKG